MKMNKQKCEYYQICGAEQGYVDCDGSLERRYGCTHYQLIKVEIEQDLRNGVPKKKELENLAKESVRFGERIRQFGFK